MDYEIVELKEKNVVGISVRTNNSDPNMGNTIGSLWTDFFGKDVFFNIENEVNKKSIGLYTDYESDEKGDYTFVACRETTKFGKLENGLVSKKIPSGKYARFVLKGNMKVIVGEFWLKLWNMPLDRTYIADYEEYQNSDPDNAEIHVYIGIK